MKVMNDNYFPAGAVWEKRLWQVIVWLLVPFAALAAPEQPVFSIADFVTCESASMKAPHDWHVSKEVFQTSDERFYAWVQLTNASGVYPVEMKVYRPDGTYYGKEIQTVKEPGGCDWWRMSAWWGIRGQGMADTPGRWRLDLVIAGAVQWSIYFQVNAQNPAPVAPAQSPDDSPVAPLATEPQTVPGTALGTAQTTACVIEASSDLVNWTPVQTNALPASLPWNASNANVAFRLTLRNLQPGLCVLEASPDLVNWTPLLTNALPCLSPRNLAAGPEAVAQFYRAVLR